MHYFTIVRMSSADSLTDDNGKYAKGWLATPCQPLLVLCLTKTAKSLRFGTFFSWILYLKRAVAR
jgi:hypothetical protein